MTIDDMIERTIGMEGGYTNNAADPGGATRWGITERVARANGYTGSMQTLPRATAVAIYRQQYAVKPGFAAVAEVYPDVGAELFDTGVNMGPGVPALWLQEALNGLNNQGKLYPDIKEDGDIGPGTLNALKAYKAARGAEGGVRLTALLNGLQAARYLELSRTRQTNETFLYGWLARIAA